jgi:hypothetical protein
MEEKIALAPVLVKQEAAHARRVRELLHGAMGEVEE